MLSSNESEVRHRRFQRGSGSGILSPRQLKLLPHQQKGETRLLVPTGPGDTVPSGPADVTTPDTPGTDAQGAKAPPPAVQNDQATKDLNAPEKPHAQLAVSVVNATYEL